MYINGFKLGIKYFYGGFDIFYCSIYVLECIVYYVYYDGEFVVDVGSRLFFVE